MFTKTKSMVKKNHEPQYVCCMHISWTCLQMYFSIFFRPQKNRECETYSVVEAPEKLSRFDLLRLMTCFIWIWMRKTGEEVDCQFIWLNTDRRQHEWAETKTCTLNYSIWDVSATFMSQGIIFLSYYYMKSYYNLETLFNPFIIYFLLLATDKIKHYSYISK